MGIAWKGIILISIMWSMNFVLGKKLLPQTLLRIAFLLKNSMVILNKNVPVRLLLDRQNPLVLYVKCKV